MEATQEKGQRRSTGPKDTSLGKPTGSQSNGQARKSRSHLLIAERPLVLLPTLAGVVGVEQAIALQQIHFRLDVSEGAEFAGHRWYYATYEQWQAHDFTFWSVRTVRRTMQALEASGLLVACQPEGRNSRRKYYRINYDKL